MTTKEQERKALAQIKKIIDSLGENSYVATAFEGCFEVATQNIENDFACSMMQRAESAEKKAAELTSENRELKATIQKIKDETSATFTILQEKIKSLEALNIGPDYICDLEDLVNEQIYTAETKAAEAAETIVTWSDNPASNAFKTAVSLHRSMKQRKGHFENIKANILKAKKASIALK